jgi:hypothetical protein
MTEPVETLEAKENIRRAIRKMGAVVVSIGLEEVSGQLRYSVGVSRGFDRLPSKDLRVNNYPVHVFHQSFGRLG